MNNNMLLCILPAGILVLLSIIVIIIAIIKQVKHKWISTLILIILMVGSIMYLFPFYKDAFHKNQNLDIIEGYFVRDISMGDLPFTSLEEFSDGDKTSRVLISDFLYSSLNLKKDVKYRVTYYKNSRILHEIYIID